jgi:hypothetical protein
VEVNAGTRIIFKITAMDREHGFEISNVKDGCVKIKKGETATVEYMAEKAGTVEFKCCVFLWCRPPRHEGKDSDPLTCTEQREFMREHGVGGELGVQIGKQAASKVKLVLAFSGKSEHGFG